MRRISSKWTCFNKRVLPVISLGILAAFAVIIIGDAKHQMTRLSLLAMPIVMAAFGYHVMKKLCFVLVDEVWDSGDYLVIKNRGIEERVLFSDIKNVNWCLMTKRITLTLRQPCSLGAEVVFSPTPRLLYFYLHPIASELKDKVGRACQA